MIETLTNFKNMEMDFIYINRGSIEEYFSDEFDFTYFLHVVSPIQLDYYKQCDNIFLD